MTWTKTPPGPPPPGPATDVSNANPKWDGWAKNVLNEAWAAYLWSSIKIQESPVAEITASRAGRRIPFPISGDDPGGWEADGGTWEGTLGVETPITEAEATVDYTRYKRVYPKVVFQEYQELIVTLKYGWGSCGAWSHFWYGKFHCLHVEREFVFWYPVGQPVERKAATAYRWVHTSTKKSGGVSVPGAGGVAGSGSTFIPWDPENPPPEPEPDDFHPDHKSRPEGKRNGPFVGYGPLANATNAREIVAARLARVVERKREGEPLDASDLAEAVMVGFQTMEYFKAEKRATDMATREGEASGSPPSRSVPTQRSR